MADGKIPNLGKSIDDIRAELFARIEEAQDEYQEKGWLPARLNLNKGIVRGILELVCWMIWQLYQVLNTIYRQAVPLEASGEWLDVHAVQVGISRKPELRAEGSVTFSRPEGADTNRNIPIPAGTIVRTLPDGKGEVYRTACGQRYRDRSGAKRDLRRGSQCRNRTDMRDRHAR